ncbi:MliC family protein [Pseudomonas sp. Gutcm_11s]|uniref:MliC family protein n=1 Tax=Pseudomonas sp. Gutcm_11s TaxID=3026088 RepID=UPI00235E5504|nr:MliC family protein [Pseudomonas sp. Gutcm_11s]MDD0845209.1 MliC family protein [Pseudomonas sp. Gutcm_11s]
MRALILALSAPLLSACASQSEPADQWTRWVCDSQAEVLWRPVGDEAVDLRLGGGDIVHRLQREPSGSGVLYSDGILAFHSKGEEGLVYRVADNDLIGRGCKAQ